MVEHGAIPWIENLGEDIAQGVQWILFDIDDTFTLRGRIPVSAFQALWDLRRAGLHAVAITGRPAGWCDHIARMWPVSGVVGENGALCFWYDEAGGRLRKRFLDPENVRQEKRTRLLEVGRAILATVPGAAIASDQRYRETDLAIDVCEDVPALPQTDVVRVCRVFQDHGARCKISSIHINGWFGDYDKLKMTRIFVQDRWGLDLDAHRGRFFFCGDSPNDEPMFAFFPHTAGVHNVLQFLDKMRARPAYLARKEGGEGFAEIVHTLLGKRPPLGGSRIPR